MGQPYQRGAGLGQFFSGLFSRILPVLSNAAKVAGKQALSTAATVVGDVVRGGDFRESLSTRGKEGIAILADKAAASLNQSDATSSAQTGGGRKYKRGAGAAKKRTKKRKITSGSRRKAKKRCTNLSIFS
jgi:hypothetical protein